MNVADKVAKLFDKDTVAGFENLKELEELAQKSDVLYGYFEQFLKMIKSDQYVIRTRGFRLLCQQAKWDKENKINQYIDEILANIKDEKPTAVRQKLAAIKNIVAFKPELKDKVKQAVLKLDYSHFKDTMQPLIKKDAEGVLNWGG